ncbi:PASTA domain-containing protein [Streptomyces sp. NPDC002685]|uniref:PASTA domain-containing protein n=1 Tax=Streptomyces sp. NPDC002685 TaxID=3154540 RepID=UPI00331B646D
MAAGVSQANPFFKEDGTLGRDTADTPQARPIGGVQASNSPGLYGGTPGGTPGGHDGAGGQDGNHATPGPHESGEPTPDFGGSAQPGTCAVAKLKKFLTAPKNSAKAREWARILNIRPDQISGYIDRLTPVVLRHDTLVTNHEYKHGKAVPFDALLQAGIAVLVDRQGLPAVKCSCGNPLRPSKVTTQKTSVRFQNGNRKWSGYRQDRIVVVEPPPGKARIDRLRLVDVENPDRGITRPLGTEGEDDTPFDPHAETTVPQVTGLTFAEASGRLTDVGLALAIGGGSLPSDDARVTSSQPVEGSPLEWGAPVTLFVSDPGAGETSSAPPDTGGRTPSPDRSSPGPGESSVGPGESSAGADSGETTRGTTTTGPTGGTSTGETTTGPTGPTGETSTGATTTGPTGETTTGTTSTGPTGETSAGTTSTGPTGETSTGATTTGPTGETTTGTTSTGPTGETSAGESGSAASGSVGDSVGPSSSAEGAA